MLTRRAPNIALQRLGARVARARPLSAVVMPPRRAGRTGGTGPDMLAR